MQTEAITTCIRIRPITLENEICCQKFEEKYVLINTSMEKYNFEYVYDSSTETQQIFENIGVSLIDQCLQGINGCIFAYGQTFSGKTFTMKGTSDSPGFIPQSLSYIFSKLAKCTDIEAQIKLSYLEIYNEQLNDLLNREGVNLEIRESIKDGVFVPNLSEKIINNEFEAKQFFYQGEQNRKFGETSLNDKSSRSHTMLLINFEVRSKKYPSKILHSKLNLIDLAGSENVQRAQTKDQRLKEGVNINKSLLALSNVITNLSTKSKQFINYRDSKLTRILKPSLDGNCKTVIICAINPHVSSLYETIQTLKFGRSAGVIKQTVSPNEQQAYEGRNSINCNSEKVTEMQKEIDELKIHLDGKIKEITNYETEIESQVLEQEYLKKENQELKQLNSDLTKEKNKLIEYNQELQTFCHDIENQNSFQNSQLQNQIVSELQKQLNQFSQMQEVIENELQSKSNENQQLKDMLVKQKDSSIQQISRINEEKSEKIKQFQYQLELKEKEIKLLQKQIHSLENFQSNKENLDRTPKKGEQLKQTQNIKNLSIQKQNSVIVNELQQKQEDQQIFLNFVQNPIENNNSSLNLQLIEKASNATLTIIQKNQQLNQLDIENQNLKEENLELKNQILYYKNQILENQENSKILENSMMENSCFEQQSNVFQDSVQCSFAKKRRILDFSQVEKKIKNSPQKQDMKREIMYLKKKNRNLQETLNKQQDDHKSIMQKMHELRTVNMVFENQLNLYNDFALNKQC